MSGFAIYDLRSLSLYELHRADAASLHSGRVTLRNGDALLAHEWAPTEDAAYVQAEKLVQDHIAKAQHELQRLYSLRLAIRERKLQIV